MGKLSDCIEAHLTDKHIGALVTERAASFVKKDAPVPKPFQIKAIREIIAELEAENKSILKQLEEAKGQEDTTGPFKKGDRVVLEDGSHGEITRADAIIMQALFGGKKETSYMYEVMTDDGKVKRPVTSEITPETGDEVAPEPIAKTPMGGNPSNLADYGLTVTKGTTNNGKDVWNVSGKETRTWKDTIKKVGGRWYGPKKVWSFYNGDPTADLLAALPAINDVHPSVRHEAQKPEASPYGKVADVVAEKLSGGNKFTRNDLFDMTAEAFGGTLAEGKFSAKDAYDAMEMGINKHLLTINEIVDPTVLSSPYAESAIANLKELFDLIPTQTTRTEEMDEWQQFSTPPALAYTANWVANLNPNDVYLEPSGGTGNIAIFAKIAGVKETIINELAPRRAAILKEMGFDQVFTENAEQINNILPADIKPTVVVMNPPFSSTAGRMQGQRKTTNITVHIEQALKRLVPGGRLVAITGEGMTENKPSLYPWWKKIGQEYNVRANVGIDGQAFKKYGTTFGNQIIVIDKPLSKETLANTDNKGIIVTGKVDKIEDLINLLEGVRNERINLGEQQQAEQGKQESPDRAKTDTGRPVLPATGTVGNEQQQPLQQQGLQAEGNDIRDNDGMEPVQSDEVPDNMSGQRGGVRPSGLAEGEGKPGGVSRSDNRSDQRSTDGVLRGDIHLVNLTVEQKADVEKQAPITDAVFDEYKPAKLSIPNAQPHPGRLVESAAMASIEPIDPTYSPKLPEKAVKSGKISIAQLEAVVYAGQAHEDILPDGKRKGFLIGDGTGVGKGREIAAILWDNWNQGRHKAVWVSQNSPLIKDAARDIEGVGWNPKLLFDIGKSKLRDSINAKEGIGFVGYGTLRTKKLVDGQKISRLDQLVNWLGSDFDGVIAFDESHNMRSAEAVKGKRGQTKPSETALAGIELQNKLPKARIVYVSATGATEVMNLAYATRLGLWGDKTAFANAKTFIQDISAGGITSMEMVAMNMKANGVYLARSLAYDDVKYDRLEHPLTKEQRQVYDELAGAWQITLQDINKAMEATGVVNSEGKTQASDAKSHIMAKYWGTNQRFWNQIITSMQMPSVISAMENDIKNGNSVIAQLVNTNEAAQERAISKMEEEDSLEDLDITPKEALIEYVNNSFPIHQFEEYTDEEGNKKSRLAVDSQGNPVINQEAVQMRDDLIMKLASIRVPDGPLEMLLDHFGTDTVAEVTGRSRRVVYKNTPEGKKRVTESWGKNKGMADADNFMADKKKILVFSKAGGTGRSYHADNESKNKRLRRHYLLQAGWQADAAVQGLGRSHRSNQKQAPEWILVTTDLKGQKRFISSIARRLNQLGALTRGQRETGSQGLFSARDNLESTEAREALVQLIQDIYHGEIPDLTIQQFMEITGLHGIVDTETGGLNQQGQPEITQFLNRILNMQIDVQNTVFDEFSKRLDIKVAKAIENGTLDTGVETIHAKKTEKISEQVVYTDPKTKAKAKFLEVELTHDAKLVDFEKSQTYNKYGYAQNIKSGRIWALAGERSITDKDTGDVKPGYVAVGANYAYHNIPIEDINNPEKYKKISKKDAELFWNNDLEKIPKEVTERLSLVTGTILPIWDRLPRENARVYRLQVDGKNIIGRVIEKKDLSETLSNLGATQSKVSYTPESVFGNILHHGYSYRLANGWRIERRKVAGENRIEIKGPDYNQLTELKKYGVFTERIAYDGRHFIPTDNETGINAVKNIIDSRPVVEETIPHGAKASDMTSADVNFNHDTGKFTRRDKNGIIDNKGDQNGQVGQEGRPAPDVASGIRERDSVLPEVSQEHGRRVGAERQVISEDAKAPLNLRKACKDGEGITHYPEGYNTPEYQEAQSLVEPYGLDVIPIVDSTNSIGAFIRKGAIFLNMDFTGSNLTVAQIILHEVSHHLHKMGINLGTHEKIDTNSKAFITYRDNISKITFGKDSVTYTNGERLSVKTVLEEYAADLEAGVETQYGVKLSDGLKKGETIEVIPQRGGQSDLQAEGEQYQKSPIQDLVDSFDDGSENLTVEDVVNGVEDILLERAKNGEDTDADFKLQKSINKFRKEQEYDNKVSGRGDMDTARDKVMSDIENYIQQGHKETPQYSIREPQAPPVNRDPKVLNFYLKDETDALVKTIMNKLRPQHMTWLETMLKSPEWFGHKQINNIVKIFMRDRNEIYHETFNDLNMADDIDAPESTVTEAAKALKNKGLSLTDRMAGKVSKEYQRLQEIIDEGDTSWKRDTSKPLTQQIKDFEDHIRKQGATEDTIRVWRLYRQSYDKALDIQTAQLRNMIAEIIEEATLKGETPDLTEMKQTLKGALAMMEEWRGFYAPRLREQGNWKVQAYKEHGPLRENREWYREHRGSELAAQRLANKLKREGWKIHDVGETDKLPESIYQDVNAVATAKLIDSALDKLNQKNPLSNEQTIKFNEEVLREVSNAIKARGFRSTMIHRGKGAVVRGFIEDPILRHLQYINNLSGGIAKAKVARMAMYELLGQKIMGQQVGGIDPIKEPREYTVAQNYIEEQLRNADATDRIVGLAKSIATFKFLGFNLRSLAVNMTAIMTTAPAAIHQYAMGGKGSMSRVLRELARSGKDYGSVMAGKKLSNADEQSFMDDMQRKGWDDAQYTREALGEISKTHSRIWSTMMDGSMYLFGKSEQWNRGTTLLAAYRIARREGLGHAEAMERAHESSNKAHGVYGKSTMPMWAQGTNPAAKIGQMMYVYQKFGHNYLQMLYDLGFKRHNIKAAMFAFLSPLVLAGGAALPFKDVIFGFAGVILRSLFGEDRDPEKWVWDIIREHLGKDAERIGRHGLTGAAGLDISGSLSIGVGVPKNLIDLTGAIGGVATEFKESVENVGRGRYGKAAEHLLPSGLANPVRAIREANEGVSTRANRRVWGENGKPYVPGAAATIARVTGFRSADQAVLSERTWEGHREQTAFAEKRSGLYERYRAWLLGGKDESEHKEIVKAVRDYNDQVKKLGKGEVSRITFDSLRTQARQLSKPSKRERAILAN